MSDKPEKCPFCGADVRSSTNWSDGPAYWFDCETYKSSKTIIRKKICYERQIANLQAELAEAKEFIEEVVQIGRLMKGAISD